MYFRVAFFVAWQIGHSPRESPSRKSPLAKTEGGRLRTAGFALRSLMESKCQRTAFKASNSPTRPKAILLWGPGVGNSESRRFMDPEPRKRLQISPGCFSFFNSAFLGAGETFKLGSIGVSFRIETALEFGNRLSDP